MSTSKNTSILSVADLKLLWAVVAKNWYIALVLTMLTFGIGFIYSYKLTDIYSAKTQILLKANNSINTASIISENGGFYGGAGQSFVDNSNEIRVIQSYDLMKKTLDRLDLDVSYFLIGRIRTEELFTGIPFKIKVLNLKPALYEQSMRIKLLDWDRFQMSYNVGKTEVIKTGFFDKEFIDPDFHLVVNRAPGLDKGMIESLKLLNYMIQIHRHESLIYSMLGNLEVKNPDYTNVLELSLNDPLPERAIVLLDTLAQVYIENTLKSKFQLNENTLNYIDKQMAEVTVILNSIEDTMQGYKEKHSILDLGKEGETYFSKLTQYDANKVEVRMEIEALNDLETYIIAEKDPELLPPSVYIVKGDGFLQSAVTELYNLQLARNTALNTAKVGSPAITDVDKRIGGLKRNLLIYIGNLRVALNQKMEGLETEITNYIGDIKSLPQKQRGLLNIQRKLTVNEGMYVFLLQKRANTVIARASIIPETKVIETARSVGLVKPDRKKIITSFSFFGLFVSIVIIVIRSVMFARIESIEELKAKTNLSIIGEVIFMPTISELLIAAETEPKSQIAEAFRTIRTNLQYLSAAGPCKTIVITSNNPGEGKTFCCLNLAGILAKAGKRVLVLELDLHKPRVQKGLNLEADIGISTIVIGKNTISECVKHSQIENLDAILSGPLPPNPSEIILSKELQDIIDFGKEHYDYVIIDTPPVGLISDAVLLMKSADVRLFVLNTKFPYKDSLNNAHEIVEMNKFSHFAFILNAVKRRKSKYYYNRYGYGYGGTYGGYGGYGGGYGSYGSYGGGYGEKTKKK